MKKILVHFNWKNFLRRTVLFFLFIVGVHLIYELFRNNTTILQAIRINIYGKLIPAVIFGLIDSKTWNRRTNEEASSEPQIFHSLFDAFKFYFWFAFFIALICALFMLVIGCIALVVIWISGTNINGNFSESIIPTLLLIGIISIGFTLYNAFQNYLLLKKKEKSS